MWMYFLYKLARWLSLVLSLPTAYRVGVFLTWFKFCFARDERKAVRENLSFILKTEKPLKISKYPRLVYANFGRYLVDFFRSEKITREYIGKYIKIENLHYIDEALKRGKGVIGLTAHIGNWELSAQILAQLGYKVNAIALTHTVSKIDKLFNQQREVAGVKVISVGVSVRQCFAALKKNEIVGILGDRDFSGENGIFVDFLGKKLLAPRGPAVLSLRTGAAIVPGFVIRDKKDQRFFTYTFEKPIYPQRTLDEEADIRRITESFISVIEKYILKNPEQWFMFREFSRPEKIEIL